MKRGEVWWADLPDPVANASLVITVDKSFLTEKAGKLRKPELQKLESGLRLVLGL
jgi:mRNA-degrading endonuclease toxin of MazEF toxin-antitoxin module